MSTSGSGALSPSDLASLKLQALSSGLPLAGTDEVDAPARRVSFDSMRPVRGDIGWATHYAEALFRNQTLLNELAPHAHEGQILVLTRSWSDSSEPAPRDRWLDHFIPSSHWFSRQFEPSDPVDPEPWEHLYLAEVNRLSPAIPALLVLEANDQAASPVLFDRSMTWTFSPCDEGGHVFAPSVQRADRFRAEHSEWLTRPVSRSSVFDGTPAIDEPLQWELDLHGVPQENVRRLSQLAYEHNLVPREGLVSVGDPQRSLRVRLSRSSAQLIRIVISGRSEHVRRWGSREPELIDHARAAEILLRPEEGESLIGEIDEFVDEDSYRAPEEAAGGALERRFRDPDLNYDGIREE